VVAFLFIVLSLLIPGIANAEPSQSAVVIVPVTDVWSDPAADPSKLTDDRRETQILFGERVEIRKSSGPWVQIEAVEQPTFRQRNRWEGYPGWVLQTSIGQARLHSNKRLTNQLWEHVLDYGAELPIGSCIFIPMNALVYSSPPTRFGILETANLFLGTQYLWGGLTPDYPPTAALSPSTAGEKIKYGIDCSGLVHLAFRVHDMVIPRDAHEQWMKAKPIKRADLKPADLIFSAKADNPKIVTHVALYAGDGQIIEAPQAGLAVRKISFEQKYGKALENVESGDRVGERVIYFGSFLR